jgi:hypothetical protein
MMKIPMINDVIRGGPDMMIPSPQFFRLAPVLLPDGASHPSYPPSPEGSAGLG